MAIKPSLETSLSMLELAKIMQQALPAGVTNDMRVAREEIFGPVACAI